ncbi:MAG: DUF6883 domain-containing protein [Cyanobacteria bacterium J06638_28]
MVFLSKDAIIAEEKLTQYLLIPLPKDDKSKFLQRAGYLRANWHQLERDLRSQVLTQPAEFVESNRFGAKYRIRARLEGINGLRLSVVTIWMVTGDVTRFVTLVPDKGENDD